MLFQDLAFWILALVAIGGALGVVLVRDLFRAALLLAAVFVAVAGFFVLLSAPFLAVVQVLIYVGAISILFIFAVMLTSNVQQGNRPNRLQTPAVLFPALLLAAMIFVALTTDWAAIPQGQQRQVSLVQSESAGVIPEASLAREGLDTPGDRTQAQEAGLADLLIGRFVLPFEAVSVLLLAALVGGLALARSREA